MKSATCVLIPRDSSHSTFLAVSRRHDSTRWGLPGGKVDPGETSLQAVLREVREETGLSLSPEQLEPLYCGVCPGKGPADTYWVTTYVLKGSAPDDSELSPEEGLGVQWLCAAALQDMRRSPFAQYNVNVFNALRQYFG